MGWTGLTASCDLSANRCLSRPAGCDWSSRGHWGHDSGVCSFVTQALHKSHQSTGLLSLTPITPVAAATRHTLTRPNDFFFLCYLKPESSINSQIQSPVWRGDTRHKARSCNSAIKQAGLLMGQWWDAPVSIFNSGGPHQSSVSHHHGPVDFNTWSGQQLWQVHT